MFILTILFAIFLFIVYFWIKRAFLIATGKQPMEALDWYLIVLWSVAGITALSS